MSVAPLVPPLEPTPNRPPSPIGRPPAGLVLSVEVIVGCTHLANPLVAVSRLLASEAEAFARVVGDEERFTVSVALPDAAPGSVAQAEAWVRWAVHNAGVRGTLTRRSPAG